MSTVCESGCKHGECVGPDQCHCHPGFTGKTCNQDKKLLSICYDKPGHKKCKCTPSVNRKGYDCKSVVKVTIEPARPVEVTVSPTNISTATTPMTTTRETTTTTTTTTTALMSSTTTLDNRIHRENTAKPRGDVHKF
ncbi:cell wall integrity and stress response component 4 [Sinocyclocheilus rhinocerous]|uniref:cell wall integrity and stress response component 4 n=1 Tax=Sinocyclocheilus rhinocerous TaxID=307959 RepID=UPI0007B8DBBB|nr:PREDICTED: cell wall integrity and stress response component 4-like [Sinocyclocheilus rhinocerous]